MWASHLQTQERYAEAEKVLRDLLLSTIVDFGKEHNTTVVVAYDLAMALKNLNRLDEAATMQVDGPVAFFCFLHPYILLYNLR